MTLQECYQQLGGDLAAVLSRLPSERMVQKFVLKFPADGSYAMLEQTMADHNYDEAFRMAHTIKGMCQNLNFDRLADSSSRMTEALRAGQTAEAETLLPEVAADYKATIDAIKAYEESLPTA